MYKYNYSHDREENVHPAALSMRRHSADFAGGSGGACKQRP